MSEQAVTILNVEDNEVKRYAATRLLQRAGFAVREAHNGAAALDMVKENTDLVLLDIGLPDINGFEVCRAIKSDPNTQNTPVLIFSSTHSRSEDRIYGLDRGADGYLPRDAGPDELVATVRALLRMRAAEERARRLALQWRETFDAINDGILLVDGRGLLLRRNKWAEKRGLGGERPIGRDLGSILPEPEGARTLNLFRRAVELNQTLSIEAPAGDNCFSISAHPVTLDGDAAAGAVIILHDVTDRKNIERELRGLNQTLESRVQERTAELVRNQKRLRTLASELTVAKQRERQRLSGDLHDHLAQLLVVCKMKLSMLGARIEDPGKREILKSGADLLNEALAYTRNLIAALSPRVLFDSGLVPAFRWLADQMEKNGLKVSVAGESRTAISEDQAICVYQAVRELLFNALKHSGVSEAEIEVDDSGGKLMISVRDRGAGFDIAAAGLESPGKFGLFNVRERMLAMGGELTIESAPGEGTRATIILPPAEAAPQPRASAPPVSAGPTAVRVASPPGLIRIMIADDHHLVRQGMASLLEANGGFEVVGEAADGEIALRLAVELEPDVIIMDINMPGMNGVEATRRIRENNPPIKIVAVSVNSDSGARSAALEAGAAAFLPKDCSAQELCGTIRAVHKGA